MCRGVVEELNIYDFRPVLFEEEEEEELPDGQFMVDIGNGLYAQMDIDDYHDFFFCEKKKRLLPDSGNEDIHMILNFSNNFMLKEN